MTVFSYISEIIQHHFDDLAGDIKQEAELYIASKIEAEKDANNTELTPTVSHKAKKHASVSHASVFSQVGGIPGSGKSTFCRSGIRDGIFPQDAILVKFDDVMTELSGYQRDLADKEITLEQAFTNWEGIARVIGYELLDRAIQSGRDIIFENSGAYLGHVELLRWLGAEKGYKTVFYYVNCPLEIAIQRVNKRNSQGDIFISEEMITARYKSLSEGVEKYREVASKFITINQ